MLNSVAKYLWGSSSDHEQDYTNTSRLEQQHGTGEHLETQQDEDWVVVAAADKENSGHPSHQGSHHHHHHHPHHHHPHHSGHGQQPQSAQSGGHDSLSQNSSGASDAELLDDAATLAESMAIVAPSHPNTDISYDSPYCPLQDCGLTNQDLDKYSDTESLPESIFSASSGKSHATYHPHGKRSEPWVVAPPPCFTGSQVGELSPIASSPLENLLIEHPSMSVYLSVPPSSLPPSHPFYSNHLTGETALGREQEETEREVVSQQREQRGEAVANESEENTVANAGQARNRLAHAAVHSGLASPQQMVQSVHSAQRVQNAKAQKLISNQKCERQNKVREYQGHAKSYNRRNKRMRPSGFRASRNTQRM